MKPPPSHPDPRDRALIEMLERVLGTVPTFIHVLSGPDFVFEYANAAYHRLVGRSDLIGRAAFEALPEAAAGGYEERIATVMATRVPFYGTELPVTLARSAGAKPEQRLIDLVYLPLVDADGSCTRVLGHGTDVTDNVLARREARRAEHLANRRLESALAAGRMATWEWDPESDRLTASASMRVLFDLDPREEVATSREGLRRVHPDDRENLRRLVRQAVAEGGAWHTEFRIDRSNGEVAWLEGRAHAAKDPGTGKVSMVGLAWDVTGRKKAEERLHAADARKEKFLATLAHELRNPLAPIRSGLQILKMSDLQEPRLVRVREVMERQMSHLVRLVDDLMDVSRINHGKVELRKERLLLGSILSAAIEANAAALEARQIALSQDLGDAGACFGDRDRLIQVFSNLIGNAVKFTEPGGTVSLLLRQGGPEFVVTVQDSGCGIEATALESVFELFSQAPRHQMSGGLGIGLALSRQLVELHGGSIVARSEGLGRGSSFVVRLPSADGEPGPLAIENADAPAQTGTPRRHILVLDDNRDAADSLASALELDGHAVVVAYDGPAALRALDAGALSAAILDIGMPGMDGYEVARRMRAHGRGTGLHLIALSGWGRDEDVSQALQAGFDDHLTKPVDVDRLSSLLLREPAGSGSGSGGSPATGRKAV